eukprot:TRINITY_DN3574_c0_g1_i1.p1 TRINITY_DN3574_c0_g1~~TRINITY_DN3574_c0_g1_i1.p1  ORF type:complete len:135 (+),score=25.30 TRINITY_DN3574_c0_g1_i1:538-942(+)
MVFLIGYNETSNPSFERLKLFFFTIPYFVDVVSGIFALKLLIAILETREDFKVVPNNLLDNLLPNQSISGLAIYSRNYTASPNCVVCKSRKREILFIDCGHKCLCQECKDEYMSNHSICPVCKQNIKRCIRINN